METRKNQGLWCRRLLRWAASGALLLALSSCIQSGMGDYLSTVGKYHVASPRTVSAPTAEVYLLDGDYFLKVPVYYPKAPTRGMFKPVLPYGGWAHPLIPEQAQRTLSFDDEKSLHEYYAEPGHNHIACNYVFVKLNNETAELITNRAAAQVSSSSNVPNIIDASDFDYGRASLCKVSASRTLRHIDVPYLNDVREKCTVGHYALMPVTCCAYVADVPVSAVLTLGYPMLLGIYQMVF